MTRLRQLWEAMVAWYGRLSDRDRRVVIGLGVVTGIVLAYVLVIEPLKNLRTDLATQIAEKHAQLESEGRLVTRVEALRIERDSLRQRLKVEKEKLLPGESPVLAKATLQERLNTLANEKNVSVQSVQDLKEEQLDPFIRVAVRIMLSGEIRPLAEMIAALEFGKTEIAVPFIEMNRRGAVPGAKGPRPLSATVEASGFLLSRAAAEAPAEGEAAPAEGGAAAAGGEVVPPPEAEGVPTGETPPAEGTGGLEIVPGRGDGEKVAAPDEGATPPGEKPVPPDDVPPSTTPPSTATPDAAPPSTTPPVTTPPETKPPAPPRPASPPKPEGIVDGTAPPPVPREAQ